MNEDDLPVVLEIDRLSFPIPWSERTYRFELKDNQAARLKVAEVYEDGRLRIIGYVGFWFIVDEAHISTLAVHPDYRGQGIGEQLLQDALHDAVIRGALVATLEVRVSNDAAVSLYRKFGFEIIGQRQRYYRDNNEDALLMILNDINGRVSGTIGGGG
jgi:ribosomal-protein-alanine N-acetyltransferase